MKLHLLPRISTNLYMDVMKSCKEPTSMKVAKHLMIHKTLKKKIGTWVDHMEHSEIQTLNELFPLHLCHSWANWAGRSS